MNHLEDKIKNLLNSMTLRDKLGQLIMVEPVFALNDLNEKGYRFESITDPNFLDLIINKYNIGFFLFGGITRIGNDELIDWATHLDKINKFALQNGKLPLLFGVDAIHGANFAKGTTIFSHNLGVASTWNPDLAQKYMNNVSKELRSIGINFNFAPTIDVARDQRWGRVYESLGEDAFLASRFSQAFTKGLQESGEVAGCAKHFIGYGESSNGMDRTPADLSERSILENHLPPFQAAIDENVLGIMVNGGDVNGVPMPASKRLLTDVLRDKLQFKGVTVSDWEDVLRLTERHKITTSKKEAVMRSFNAGLDVNMAVCDFDIIDIMEELVNEGKITLQRVNEAVGNVLRVKLSIGLDKDSTINYEDATKRPYLKESKELAKQVALESLTLLKNNGVLPLDSRKYKNILVTGKTANSKRHMCGGWTLNWASANEEDLDFKTILDVLKEEYPQANIQYAKNKNDLKNINQNMDVIISVIGEEPHSEWLGDSFDLHLEQDEYDLMNEVIKFDTKKVVVSLIGRPAKVDFIDQKTDALLWANLPGSEGAKPIVDVLFGKENPSGKTPITFPKDGNQIPIYYNQRMYYSHEITTKYDPLYPFGHGLSYTSFTYQNISLPSLISTKEDLTLSLDVTNTGNMDGMEIVMVYIKDLYASVTRPYKSLKGFKKIFLKQGETKRVTLQVSPKDLSIYGEYLELSNEEREIEVLVGNLSQKVKIKE